MTRKIMSLRSKAGQVGFAFLAFILATLFIAQLEMDPVRIIEVEDEEVREYIVIRKSNYKKLERKGEAKWLNQ